MRKFLLAAILFVCIALSLSDQVDFTLCSPPEDPHPYQISSIDMNPVMPHPGDVVAITIVGSAQNGTTGGSVVSEISKAGIKLFSFTYDLCESVIGGCPVPPGESKIVIHQNTPRFAFPGEYDAVNHAYNADKGVISCAKFKFTVQ